MEGTLLRFRVGCQSCGRLGRFETLPWALAYAREVEVDHWSCGPLRVTDVLARPGEGLSYAINGWVLTDRLTEAARPSRYSQAGG